MIFWEDVKCFLGFHSKEPMINAKWDICVNCGKIFRVVW